jgi:hypothetical protein
MMLRSDASGPAARKRPGPGTGSKPYADTNLQDPAVSAAESKTKTQGIAKRGDRYTYRYWDRHGKHRRGSARTLDEAKAKRAAALAAVWSGEHHLAGRVMFADYAAAWVDSFQGRTSRGSVGYFGPKPPVGDPPHHYHVQVFALDSKLDVPAGADRDQVLAAMQGHVVGAGELVGTYRQAVAPPR